MLHKQLPYKGGKAFRAGRKELWVGFQTFFFLNRKRIVVELQSSIVPRHIQTFTTLDFK